MPENDNNLQSDLVSSGLRVARLVTGENIIGRIEENFLINVFKINMSFDSTFGGSNISLTPYMFPITPKLNYFIPLNQCIVIDNAPDNLSQLYVETIQKIIQESIALREKHEESLNNSNNNPQNGETENGSTSDE